MPRSASFFNSWQIFRAEKESSPDVGSSRNMMLGFVISSYPMDVLFLSPPEIPFFSTFPTWVCWQFISCRAWIKDSTLELIWFAFKVVLILHAKLNSSRGVREPRSSSSYWTKAPNLQNSCEVNCWSLTSIYPSTLVVFRIFPGQMVNPYYCIKLFLLANTFNKVVLPLPEGPMIARNWPGYTLPDKLLRSFASLFTSG